MAIWLHRISHCMELSYPLLGRGYLSIGFSDFSSKEFIQQVKSEGWEYLESAFDKKWNDRPRNRYNLWRFIAEMKIGDWVIVPSWGEFSIYKIVGEATLPDKADIDGLKTWNDENVNIKENLFAVNDSSVDIGFIRMVEPVAVKISRYSFADAALTARMKTRWTNADVTDLKESVEKALKAFRENKPINLHAQIVSSCSPCVLELIHRELNPDKFELLIKWYFEQLDASNVATLPKNQRGKEGDADVIATFEPLKTIYYVQAKLHEGETAVDAVEQIRDYISQKDASDDGYAKIGWVVTSGNEFSKESEKLAKENAILLFTGPDLARMILETGIDELDKAFERKP